MKITHRKLTMLGIPRKKDGNRLGLRKRKAMFMRRYGPITDAVQ